MRRNCKKRFFASISDPMVSLFILSVFHENNKRKETIIVIVCLECEGEKNFFLVKKSKLKRNFLAGCSAARIYAGWEKFSSVIFLNFKYFSTHVSIAKFTFSSIFFCIFMIRKISYLHSRYNFVFCLSIPSCCALASRLSNNIWYLLALT